MGGGKRSHAQWGLACLTGGTPPPNLFAEQLSLHSQPQWTGKRGEPRALPGAGSGLSEVRADSAPPKSLTIPHPEKPALQ